MRLPIPRRATLAVLVLAASCAGRQTKEEGAGVVLRDEVLELPTYRVGPPEDHPIFFDGRSYQGAKGPVYPYPLLDKLGTRSAPQAWRAIRLENEYVRVVVLPEIGGRIFSALDKTNGYDFFYRQHVVKPALIGMAGAWISGGVEWNVFHHHRVTSFMPVECALQEHPDGSKTVWVGETELRHRMRWVVGLTLRPGRSTLEATVRLFNRTALPHSFLYFANPAVAVNEHYQVIFPPRTEWAASHAKDQFVDWPVGRREYKGVDYRGVDLSWIRNHPKPNSFFAWNTEDTFIAGYDHGRKAGVMHVADPRIVPGKKLWQWGTGLTGKMWEKILTDADGPYAEIMVGAWSDNQPDYSWILPGEAKTFTQVWYPIRDLGGVKNATADAAVELEPIRAGVVRLGFNATAVHREARAVLTAGDRTVFERTLAISPDRPFAAEVPFPADARFEDLRAVLLAADGRELVAYAPVRRKGEPMPEAYRPPAPPREIGTVDELAFAGSRLEQFYDPHLEPDPYYEEALRRDPGDVRANTALGILCLKRGMFPEARARFREALKRATGNHTKARDGAPHFYLGVALRALGSEAEAAESFARASWDGAFAGASWRALAELAGRRGDWADALACLDRALSANAMDTKSFALRAAVLRRAGRPAEALRSAGEALALDPLDPLAMSERLLSSAAGDGMAEEALRRFLGRSPQPYLELACDYDAAGMAFEALHVLGCAPEPDAMVHYHRGWLQERTGHAEEAAACYRRGAEAPWEGCFPSRFESSEALRAALKADPGDARARLYLGNLLYDHQPERAVAEWEEAARLAPGLSPAHRNLGFAYLRRGDAEEAVAAYERALAGRRDDPLLLVELDQAGEAAGLSPARRFRPFEENRATALRKDRAAGRMARLCVLLGRLDEALELLSNHHFHLWEGEEGMYGLYVEARAQRGEKRLAEGRPEEALADFEEALRVPPNIEVWAEFDEGRPRLAYLMGQALKARGRAAEARARLEEAASARGGGAMAYYAGLALRELGRGAEAEKVFAALVESSRRRAAPAPGARNFRERQEDRRRRAGAHYAAGLGLLGLGREAEARSEFEKAVRLDASHAGARRALSRG